MGNNLFYELGYKIILLFPLYLIHQILIELKFFLTRYILVYFLPQKIRNIILSLRVNGYCLMKEFYSIETINCLENYLKKIERLNLDLYEVKGTKKYRNLDGNEFLRLFADKFQLIIINFCFSLKFNQASLKFLITKKIPGKNQQILASHVHFDSFKNELKVMVPLSDVTDENAPTLILPKSGNYHFKFLKQYFVSWLQVHKFINENKENTIPYDFLIKNKLTKRMLLRKGDIIIFDSRFLHSASSIKKGYRSILWLYF